MDARESDTYGEIGSNSGQATTKSGGFPAEPVDLKDASKLMEFPLPGLKHVMKVTAQSQLRKLVSGKIVCPGNMY